METWDGLPPDGKYDCYTEVSRDDFFLVYSGRASIPQVGAMCLTGRIKVRWFRYQQLQQFASSFEYATPLWIAFYRGRGDKQKADDLMVQQWKLARKAGNKLVADDGNLIDAANVSPDVKAALEHSGKRYLGEVVDEEQLEQATPVPVLLAPSEGQAEAPSDAAVAQEAAVQVIGAEGVQAAPTTTQQEQQQMPIGENAAPAADAVMSGAPTPADASQLSDSVQSAADAVIQLSSPAEQSSDSASAAAAAVPLIVGGAAQDGSDDSAAAADSTTAPAASSSSTDANAAAPQTEGASSEVIAVVEAPSSSSSAPSGPILITEVVVPSLTDAAAAGNSATSSVVSVANDSAAPAVVMSADANAASNNALQSDAGQASAANTNSTISLSQPASDSAAGISAALVDNDSAATSVSAIAPAESSSPKIIALGPSTASAGGLTVSSSSADNNNSSDIDLVDLLPRLLQASSGEVDGELSATSPPQQQQQPSFSGGFTSRERYRLQALGITHVDAPAVTVAETVESRFVPLAQHLRVTIDAHLALLRQEKQAARERQRKAKEDAQAAAAASEGWLSSVSGWVSGLVGSPSPKTEATSIAGSSSSSSSSDKQASVPASNPAAGMYSSPSQSSSSSSVPPHSLLPAQPEGLYYLRSAVAATIRSTEAAAASGSVIALMLRAQSCIRPIGCSSASASAVANAFPRGSPLRDLRSLLHLLPVSHALNTLAAAAAAGGASSAHSSGASLLSRDHHHTNQQQLSSSGKVLSLRAGGSSSAASSSKGVLSQQGQAVSALSSLLATFPAASRCLLRWQASLTSGVTPEALQRAPGIASFFASSSSSSSSLSQSDNSVSSASIWCSKVEAADVINFAQRVRMPVNSATFPKPVRYGDLFDGRCPVRSQLPHQQQPQQLALQGLQTAATAAHAALTRAEAADVEAQLQRFEHKLATAGISSGGGSSVQLTSLLGEGAHSLSLHASDHAQKPASATSASSATSSSGGGGSAAESLQKAFDAALSAGPGALLHAAETESAAGAVEGAWHHHQQQLHSGISFPSSSSSGSAEDGSDADSRRGNVIAFAAAVPTSPSATPASRGRSQSSSSVDTASAEEERELRSYLRQLRLRLGNEAARYRWEEDEERARARSGNGHVSWGPRHPLLVPPAAVPIPAFRPAGSHGEFEDALGDVRSSASGSSSATGGGSDVTDGSFGAPFGLSLSQGFAALHLFVPSSLAGSVFGCIASSTSSSAGRQQAPPSAVPLTPLASGVLRHWAAAAPSAVVADASQAESAAYCMGFPLHWVGRRLVTLGAMVLPPSQTQQQLPSAASFSGGYPNNTPSSKSASELSSVTADGDTNAPAEPSGFFLPVWHPKALRSRNANAAGRGNTSPIKAASSSDGSASLSTRLPESSNTSSSGSGSGSPPPHHSHSPHTVRCAYDGLGSGVFQDNAVARVRLRYQQLAAAAAAGSGDEGAPAAASGGFTSRPGATSSGSSGGSGSSEEEQERLPYAARSVQRLLAAATPQSVRDLARRLKEQKALKVYVPPPPASLQPDLLPPQPPSPGGASGAAADSSSVVSGPQR